MGNNKKVNKELLSEELNRFKNLTDYDYYVGGIDPISENFSFYDVRQEMEGDRPDLEDDENLIFGDSEVGTGMYEVEDEDANAETPEGEEEGGFGDDAPEDLETDVEDIEGELGLEDEPAPEGEEELDLGDEEGFEEPAEDEVELDVTELVQGTEEAKQSADSANQKIDQLMGMVDNLEGQLKSMDAITNKIDNLENELEKRAPTPEEKIEMRSLNSYPYNLKLTDYWADKGDQYKNADGENEEKEYVLTQDDVDDDYNEISVKGTFSDDYTEEEI